MVYLMILITITVRLFIFSKKNSIRIILLSLWMYGILSSISDTIFMGYRGIAIIYIATFMMGIIEGLERNNT